MKIELLENLGFTKSEIKIYSCLLELNSASASEISEKTGVYRKNVYESMARLAKKGLVSSAKVETKTIFTAADPQKILEFLEVRKGELQSILPRLKEIYKAPPLGDNVTVFKGKEGLKTIFEDIIKSKANYDTFGSGEKFKQMLPYYYLHYQKKKAENKIRCRAIYSDNERDKDFVKEYIGQKKFLPKGFINPASTMIYKNKVAIIIWKDNPIGVLINSKEVADSYRYYFESLWANSYG